MGGEPGFPRRVKTKHDWRWHTQPRYHQAACDRYSQGHSSDKPCRYCGKVHCHTCGCWQPWKKFNRFADAATFEKRSAHRAFRREAKAALSRELVGDDAVSHTFFISGNWLD